MKRRSILIILGLGIFFSLFTMKMTACSGPEDDDSTKTEPGYIPPVKMTTPEHQGQYVFGDEVVVEIEVTDPERMSDLRLVINGQVVLDDMEIKSQTYVINTSDFRLGDMNIDVLHMGDDKKEHSDFRQITVFSDEAPTNKKVTVVKSFPHNPESYTQGLEFYNCELFEGTGQWGLSKLQQITMANNGQVLRAYPIPSDQFGEGITILNDTIYQLTYKAGLCYYYNMDFELLGQFNYTEEGWGLCNDGTNLIMSDGTHRIEWRDPKTFEVLKTIEIYDDQQGILNVNELEMYNGNLLANVYRQNYLIEIDTLTGKVLSKIDCNQLVSEKPIGSDVLNGIAFDPCEDKLFLTGKLWDKIYEVTFE